jgi:hypothetical protein
VEGPPQAPIRSVDKLDEESNQEEKFKEAYLGDNPFIREIRPSPSHHVLKHKTTMLPMIIDESNNSEEDDENEEPQDRRYSFPDESLFAQKTTERSDQAFRHSTQSSISTSSVDDASAVGDNDSTVVASNVSPPGENENDDNGEDDCTVVALNVTRTGERRVKICKRKKNPR